jgi:hypothetical protein
VQLHQYEIYDIVNNAIRPGYQLGQVGTDWQFAGLGRFNRSDMTDMILRAASCRRIHSVYYPPLGPEWSVSFRLIKLEQGNGTGRIEVAEHRCR